MIPDRVLELSRSGKIVNANGAPWFCTALTCRVSIGKSLGELLNESMVEAGLAAIEEALTKGQVIFREFEISVDGAPRNIDVRMAPFTADTVIAILRDITEKKSAGRRLARLSDRERSVLQLVARGAPNKQIAAELGISVKTVEGHRSALMKKLGVHSRAELVQVAIAAADEP